MLIRPWVHQVHTWSSEAGHVAFRVIRGRLPSSSIDYKIRQRYTKHEAHRTVNFSRREISFARVHGGGAHLKSTRNRQVRRVAPHARQMLQLNQPPSNSKPQKLSVPVSKQLCLIKRTQWGCCGARGLALSSQSSCLIASD